MHRLFYVSTASPEVNSDTVDAIVKKSEQNNIERGISGALAYNGFNFAQVLEGNRDEIHKLFEYIKNDNRHSGVILMSEKEITERVYVNWGMVRTNCYDFGELVKAMAY